MFSEMADMDAPLDFESEAPLMSFTVPTKKRKNEIDLDDLMTDYYKQKAKFFEKEQENAKKDRKLDDDDDEAPYKEIEVSKVVNELQQKMEEISGQDEISSWGLLVFGKQKTAPSLLSPEIGSYTPLQSFMESELNLLLELGAENEGTFLEGLLIHGWLSKLVCRSARVEKSIAKWVFNLMLYSPKEELWTSACDFWCSILANDKVLEIEWMPNYSELKMALETYGFLLDSPSTSSSNPALDMDPDWGGPPQNIRAWINFVASCCQVRHRCSILSTSEAENLLGVVMYLYLDRQLQGLSVLLYKGMSSIIGFFTDKEWDASCDNVSKHVASRVPRDLNCLRMVECISGVDTRSKQLRSALAFQTLLVCLDNQVTGAEEVLRFLISINIKEKNCDFFKMYIYLVLAENWLLYVPVLAKPLINEMWGLYLRNCNFQIMHNDLRSYASKVRNKASYLLKGSNSGF